MSIPGTSPNDLPPELLCNIFRLTIGELVAAKKDRCRLMLVCRQWREYVEGSVLLWTSISADDSPTYVRRALERSKGAMLDLHCWMYGGSHVELEAFMVEVGLHIARWRSAEITFGSAPTFEGSLGPLATTQAPRLETLRVLATLRAHHLISENAITLFGGAPAPPTLKELHLEHIPVAIEPLSLSGLVSLELIEVPTISTPQLLEILRRSPWLESLCLEGSPRLVAIESHASNIRPIELPKLDYLALNWMDNGGANCILSNIRVPNRRSVVLREDISGRSTRSDLFTPTITHLLHTTTPTTNVPPSAIRVDQQSDDDCTITFRGIQLELFVHEACIQEILRWLADGLGSEAADCPVHITLDWSEADSIPITTVPAPLIIKRLSILNSMFGPAREALYIAMAQPLDLTPSGWLYPQMESLSVEFGTVESQKQLVSMLKSRYEGKTLLAETELRCPASLRSVELRGGPRTEGLVENIKEILRKASVFWVDEETEF